MPFSDEDALARILSQPSIPPMLPTDLQRHTLRHYGNLIARRESWAGRLVFTAGEGSSATGLPAAVSIAGGCTLALDPDAPTVKSVFRQGGVDFVVNTLDEAVRVLKNEVRQHKPLSVALIAPLQPTLEEMAARGLQPDLDLTSPSTDDLLTPWLAARNWSEIEVPAPSLPKLLALLPPGDTLRRRWLQRIAHYQRPAPNTPRLLWLTPAEQALLQPESVENLSRG
jgi:urocanate hydratase